ncbi:hypothetical protein IAD21_05273 [Abditibacteriota bacterium]|nr:hypothetical protein IAD21_05273 [Abditibacteriota bacterium]
MSDRQLRARAFCNAGRLAYFQSDFPGARLLLEQALELFRQTGDEMGAVSALSTLIVIRTWQGENETALALLQEGLTLLPPVQARSNSLSTLSEFGWAASHISAPQSVEQAHLLNEEVVQRARAADEKHSLGLALACLAQCFYWVEDWDTARIHYEESVPLLREAGTLWMLEYALWGLGQTALQQGDFEAARTISSEAMLRSREVETWVGAPFYLETFAFLEAEQGHPYRAVTIIGAAHATRFRHHGVEQPLVASQTERYLKKLRAALSHDEFESAWKEGNSLSTQDAITLALHANKSDEVPQ